MTGGPGDDNDKFVELSDSHHFLWKAKLCRCLFRPVLPQPHLTPEKQNASDMLIRTITFTFTKSIKANKEGCIQNPNVLRRSINEEL